MKNKFNTDCPRCDQIIDNNRGYCQLLERQLELLCEKCKEEIKQCK